MKRLRKELINRLFEVSSEIYTKTYKKKKEPWNITKSELLSYSEDSFGYSLGVFLDSNNFELIPKVERHDCYHVLTGYSTRVEDEIALQYLSFGNGKRTPYLFGTVILGTLILPDYFGHYLKSYKKGKDANVFHDLDFKSLLKTNMNGFRDSIFSNKESHFIQGKPAKNNFSPLGYTSHFQI